MCIRDSTHTHTHTHTHGGEAKRDELVSLLKFSEMTMAYLQNHLFLPGHLHSALRWPERQKDGRGEPGRIRVEQEPRQKGKREGRHRDTDIKHGDKYAYIHIQHTCTYMYTRQRFTGYLPSINTPTAEQTHDLHNVRVRN